MFPLGDFSMKDIYYFISFLLAINLSNLLWAQEHIYRVRHQGNNWTINLPCKLEDLENLPDITLYGETHGEAWAKAEGDLFKSQAAKGDFFLGLEGVYFGEQLPVPDLSSDQQSFSRVFGIDSQFPYGLGFLVHRQIFLPLRRTNPGNLPNELSLFKNHFKDNPYLQLVHAHLSGLRGQSDHDFSSFEDYSLYLQEMTKSYVELSKSPAYRERFWVPDTVDYALDIHHERVVTEVNISWRNIYFLENILKLYCQASLEKKNLKVIVGEEHLRGLEELILQVYEDLPVSSKNLGLCMKKSLTALPQVNTIFGFDSGRSCLRK